MYWGINKMIFVSNYQYLVKLGVFFNIPWTKLPWHGFTKWRPCANNAHGSTNDSYGSINRGHGFINKSLGSTNNVCGSIDNVFGSINNVHGSINVHGSTTNAHGSTNNVHGFNSFFGDSTNKYARLHQIFSWFHQH